MATDPAISKAAKALSKLGASLGGKARAKALSKSRRREIARMGGLAGGNGRPKESKESA